MHSTLGLISTGTGILPHRANRIDFLDWRMVYLLLVHSIGAAHMPFNQCEHKVVQVRWLTLFFQFVATKYVRIQFHYPFCIILAHVSHLIIHFGAMIFNWIEDWNIELASKQECSISHGMARCDELIDSRLALQHAHRLCAPVCIPVRGDADAHISYRLGEEGRARANPCGYSSALFSSTISSQNRGAN